MMMYKGNHSAPQRQRKGGKTAVLILSLILACTLAVGGTVAWLVDSTPAITNTMIPGKVPIEIGETFNGETKSDVTVTNTGNVDAYIRVAVVANAVDNEGNIIAGTAPQYSINTAYWQELNGYYYYKAVVKPGHKTQPLFTDPVTVSGGEVNILAESIQVLGGYNNQKPETYAWGVTYTDGAWA